MSKLKTPREKKLASFAFDRRNVYGENAKASRKNIPLRKQQSHQAERRVPDQPLQQLRGHVEEDLAVHAELQSRDSAIVQKRQAFKKSRMRPWQTSLLGRNIGRSGGTQPQITRKREDQQ